MLRFSSLP